MGVKERKEREKAERKKNILSAAKKVFYKNGFNNTKLEDIAKCCELSIGTIYLYFKSKEEIYISLLFEGMEHFTKEIEKIEKQEGTPRKKLKKVWNYFYKFYQNNPELFRIIMFLNNTVLKDHLSQKTIEQINSTSYGNFILVSKILEKELTNNSETANGINVSYILWAMFIGLIHFYETRENLGVKTNITFLHKKTFEIIEKGLFM